MRAWRAGVERMRCKLTEYGSNYACQKGNNTEIQIRMQVTIRNMRNHAKEILGKSKSVNKGKQECCKIYTGKKLTSSSRQSKTNVDQETACQRELWPTSRLDYLRRNVPRRSILLNQISAPPLRYRIHGPSVFRWSIQDTSLGLHHESLHVT